MQAERSSFAALSGKLSKSEMKKLLGGDMSIPGEEDTTCQKAGKCRRNAECCIGYSCGGCPDIGYECVLDY